MSATGKSLDIACFLSRAFIIGASSLTLLPTTNRQSVSSKPLIFELNKNCDLWLKGILQPSCRHSTDFMFNVYLQNKKNEYLEKREMDKQRKLHKKPT